MQLIDEIEAAAAADAIFIKRGVFPPDVERSRECARLVISPYWPRIRAALLAGEELATAVENDSGAEPSVSVTARALARFRAATEGTNTTGKDGLHVAAAIWRAS